MRSGATRSRSNAASAAGASRNESSPGTYGKRVGRRTTALSTSSSPGNASTATAARVTAPFRSKPTSTPATWRTSASCPARTTRSRSSACSAMAALGVRFQPCSLRAFTRDHATLQSRLQAEHPLRVQLVELLLVRVADRQLVGDLHLFRDELVGVVHRVQHAVGSEHRQGEED